jgi:hypothetical protein
LVVTPTVVLVAQLLKKPREKRRKRGMRRGRGISTNVERAMSNVER